jgi:hypothetical protein
MRIVCPHWARSSRYVDNVEKFCRRVSVDVRFAPESGHRADMPACPLCAKSGHLHCNKFLLDHFVGELPELPRHIEAERLGSL